MWIVTAALARTQQLEHAVARKLVYVSKTAWPSPLDLDQLERLLSVHS